MNVKDFKDAGGRLTVGDKVKPSLNPDWHVSDDDIIEEFAWRDNTGVKPGFYGEVELMEVGGHTGLKHSSCVNWAITPQGGDANIYLWRPHLPKVESLQDTIDNIDNNFDATMVDGVIKVKPKSPYDVDAHVSGQSRCVQVDVKPIFTQAMADAGELPTYGMMVLVNDFGVNKGESKVKYCSDNFLVVTHAGDSFETCYSVPDVKFKPIQTEREKAIEDVTGEWPMADVSTIEVMHDMGYRKC